VEDVAGGAATVTVEDVAGGAAPVTVEFAAQPAVSTATPSADPASRSRAERADEVFKQILSGNPQVRLRVQI
jgi:hypothetical protein